jgi:hypothetical protein
MRLATVQNWPRLVSESRELTPTTRFSLGIIAALLTKSDSKFDAWWQSDCRKALSDATQVGPSPSPPPQTFLGGVVWMMMRDGNPTVYFAAQSMLETLGKYIPE